MKHDESFLITKGKARFHLFEDGAQRIVDASLGDCAVVPIKSPHV